MARLHNQLRHHHEPTGAPPDPDPSPLLPGAPGGATRATTCERRGAGAVQGRVRVRVRGVAGRRGGDGGRLLLRTPLRSA